MAAGSRTRLWQCLSEASVDGPRVFPRVLTVVLAPEVVGVCNGADCSGAVVVFPPLSLERLVWGTPCPGRMCLLGKASFRVFLHCAHGCLPCHLACPFLSIALLRCPSQDGPASHEGRSVVVVFVLDQLQQKLQEGQVEVTENLPHTGIKWCCIMSRLFFELRGQSSHSRHLFIPEC